MADSFNKKERDKKRRKKKQEKQERRKERKLDETKPPEFMYLDYNGNLTSTPPDPEKKKKEIKLQDISISTPKLSDVEQESTEKIGTVKFYNAEKRFGFISETGTNKDYFVHQDNLVDQISENDKVVFELGNGPKGIVAVNVRLQKKS